MLQSIEVALKEVITPALIKEVLFRESEISRLNPRFVFDANKIASVGSDIAQRTDLNVPFSEKDKAKLMGAKWDGQNKTWYVLGDSEKFSKWIGKAPIQENKPSNPGKKITVLDYLRLRHPTVNALTFAEAKILGIKYPLQTGWVKKHGSTKITAETVKLLVAAREKRKNKKQNKARHSLK